MKAATGGRAPRFDARTLNGKQFNNASLEGSVTVLQFWTTHCAECRADETPLDELDSSYAGQGLVVLAVNDGELRPAIEKYLREHPRSVRIVLDPGKQISKRFGKHGDPYYVVIDRQGRIVASHSGEAGGQGLQSLVSRAGLVPQRARVKETIVGGSEPAKAAPRASEKQAEGANLNERAKPPAEGSATEPPKPAPPKVIEVPQEANVPPAKPVPPTIFVLTNGERLESNHYTMDTQELHVSVNGQERTIPIRRLDFNATEEANRDRGVEVKIPRKKNEVFVAF